MADTIEDDVEPRHVHEDVVDSSNVNGPQGMDTEDGSADNLRRKDQVVLGVSNLQTLATRFGVGVLLDESFIVYSSYR